MSLIVCLYSCVCVCPILALTKCLAIYRDQYPLIHLEIAQWTFSYSLHWFLGADLIFELNHNGWSKRTTVILSKNYFYCLKQTNQAKKLLKLAAWTFRFKLPTQLL